MELFSYIMTVATSTTDVELHLAIKNIAGTGRIHYGKSDGYRHVNLWIIPKSTKRKVELLAQLQALAPIEQVSLVSLSKPATPAELLEVRELFTNLGLNSSTVKDEDLALFLHTRLAGQYSYHIYIEQRQDSSSELFRIIKAEDHPQFSPKWLAGDPIGEEILDRALTLDDMEVSIVRIEESTEEPPPPAPNAGGE